MKKILLSLLISLLYCTNSFAQENKSIFIFGHSLIAHTNSSPVPNIDGNRVPFWLHPLAENAANSIQTSGRFGGMADHERSITPDPDTEEISLRPNGAFNSFNPAWDFDNESFSEVNFDAVVITPENFVQYQPSNINYQGGNDHTSPLAATLTISDWVNSEEPGAAQYIYESWPNMGDSRVFVDLPRPYIFPPSESGFAAYHEIAFGSNHDWFIDLHDFVVAARPTENVKMIPVGPILSKLLTETPLQDIDIETLYEDTTPHGRPTIYFLASLITYMSIFEEKLPATYTIPVDPDNPISALVQDNYQSVIDLIWDELLAFNFDDGSSRVFFNETLNVKSNSHNDIYISPNPTKGLLKINSINKDYLVKIFDIKGVLLYTTSNKASNNNEIDISSFPNGIYMVKLINKDGSITINKILKI